MHLAVDAVGIKHGGGATVLLDFLATAAEDTRLSQITVFSSPKPSRRFAFPEHAKIVEAEQARAENSYIYRMLWQESGLSRACREIKADALFCMTGCGRSLSPTFHVTFIQQPLPFASEFASVASPQERVRMAVIKRLMRSSCRSAARVVVQTQTMKRSVSEQLSIAADRISVVVPRVAPLRASPRAVLPAFSAGAKPRLLYVGSTARYKNVQVAIAGLAQLRESFPEATLYATWPPAHGPSDQPGVVCLGYLTREQLAIAYREADVLVLPSLIETVGLPILEAMDAGLPVLVADRPYAHDVAEDAAVFFDPLSPDDFAVRALDILRHEGLRRDLIAKGRALLERRMAFDPYQQMVDILFDVASSCGHP